MRPPDNGATDALTEIAGEATSDGVRTDLISNDGTAAGDPQHPDGHNAPPPDDVELPGPTYELIVRE
jgi:hypothetical protein